MTVLQPPVLEFPAMLHGHLGTIRRNVRAQGRAWAREYLKTGGFTQPRRMLQVPPGEVLILHSGAEFDITPHPRWRLHIFHSVFMSLNEGVPEEQCHRMEEAFESFCLSSAWGALDHAVTPPPPRSAQRMAGRLAALLRFWDVLQSPRYLFWHDRKDTLEELVKDLYGRTLDAWYPGGPASVREHLTLTVERMAHATRADCMEALLRLIPPMVRVHPNLKHRQVLSDPGFVRERLAELSPEDFEDVSAAYRYAVNGPLCEWDRELSRQ